MREFSGKLLEGTSPFMSQGWLEQMAWVIQSLRQGPQLSVLVSGQETEVANEVAVFFIADEI